MRLNFRFIFSLVIIVGCISALVSWLQVRAEQQRMQADLRVRSQVLAESLQESIGRGSSRQQRLSCCWQPEPR